jgi:hypothetical protein
MAEKEVTQFKVRSDRDGKYYTAIEYQSVGQLRHPSGVFAPIEAEPLHYKLEDGRRLDPVEGPNAFQIRDTDEIVRKVCKGDLGSIQTTASYFS